MIKLTFLGTSFAIPTKSRNHTSVFFSYKNENILIDCGEGTQRQFRKAGLNPCKITRILLTHKHADHSLGLPGLLKTLDLSGYGKTLFIYGPRGIKNFIENILKTFGEVANYKIEVKEVDGKFFETDDFYLYAEKRFHGVPCNSYSVVIKEKIRINKEKRKKLKEISIENLKKLKQGRDITHNGKKYLAKNLTFIETGRKISFVYDTSIEDKIAKFVRDSDLLVCEATFHSDLEKEAKEKKHLTAEQAGEIAKKANVKQLILTHISQRYEKNLKEILDDAKKNFKNVSIAKDLESFEVK